MDELLFWLGIGAAERRWVEAYGSSALGCFVGRRYSDCSADNCRSFYFVGQPAMSGGVG
jgi:hypothetical protein